MQYKIELYGAYQREMSTTANEQDEPISERLKMLRRVTDGWATLRFSRHSILGYPLSSSFVYEVSGGRLVLGSDLGHIASHLNGTSVLSVYDLPTVTRPGSGPVADKNPIPRQDIKLAMPITDFAMDVHQNLLVLVHRTG